jgi:hypothetical protein
MMTKARLRVVWLLLGLGMMVGSAEATPITYNLSFIPSASNPTAVLSGTITTDGTLGQIDKFNITAWSFTQTGPVPFSLSSTDPLPQGTLVACVTFPCSVFTATATTLSYNFDSGLNDRINFQDGGPNQFIQFTSAPLSVTQIGYVQTAYLGSIQLYNDDMGTARAIIGTASAPATVAEPGTLVLLGVGLSALSVRRRRRCRHLSNG